MKQQKQLSVANNIFILFFAFSKTARNPSFISYRRSLIGPFVYLDVTNIMLLLNAYGEARVFRFSRVNATSVLCAAPQKTLSLGVPLISTCFATTPEILEIALLPLVFYHAWQMLIGGFVRSSRLVRGMQHGVHSGTNITFCISFHIPL
jgi:predicted Na+-dependent transporter